jgi:hypothetical protein
LTIALLPVIVKSFFSSSELDEMGIYLEKSETMSSCSFQESDCIVPTRIVPCVNV